MDEVIARDRDQIVSLHNFLTSATPPRHVKFGDALLSGLQVRFLFVCCWSPWLCCRTPPTITHPAHTHNCGWFDVLVVACCCLWLVVVPVVLIALPPALPPASCGGVGSPRPGLWPGQGSHVVRPPRLGVRRLAVRVAAPPRPADRATRPPVGGWRVCVRHAVDGAGRACRVPGRGQWRHCWRSREDHCAARTVLSRQGWFTMVVTVHTVLQLMPANPLNNQPTTCFCRDGCAGWLNCLMPPPPSSWVCGASVVFHVSVPPRQFLPPLLPSFPLSCLPSPRLYLQAMLFYTTPRRQSGLHTRSVQTCCQW